jgi:hypothetical protein
MLLAILLSWVLLLVVVAAGLPYLLTLGLQSLRSRVGR